VSDTATSAPSTKHKRELVLVNELGRAQYMATLILSDIAMFALTSLLYVCYGLIDFVQRLLIVDGATFLFGCVLYCILFVRLSTKPV